MSEVVIFPSSLLVPSVYMEVLILFYTRGRQQCIVEEGATGPWSWTTSLFPDEG